MNAVAASANRPAASAADVTGHLRRLRQGNRASATRSQVLFMVYLLGLVSLWAGVPAVGVVRALLAPGFSLLGDPVGAAAAAPLLLVAVCAGAMLLGLRLATWQGPLLVSAATIAWYLTLPLDRAAALHPPLLRGLVVWTAVGLLAGAVLGLLLASATASAAPPTVAAACGGGALLGLLTASVGLFLERGSKASRAVLVGSPVATAGVLGASVLGVLAFQGDEIPAAGAVLLWSGPWGWAAQPPLAAATGTAPLWPVALGLLAVLTTAVTVGAWRAAGEVSDGVLRTRARARSSLVAASYLGEPRDARLAAQPARARRVQPVRLRPPSSPRLVVVWRDALHLRRAPVRVIAAAAYAAAAATLLLQAGAAPGWTAAGAALLVHAAAGQLLETARLDADDPRRTALFAADSGRVATQHAALATAVLILLGWTAAAVALGADALAPGQLPLVMTLILLLAPVPVVAGLLNAYKGRPPLLLAISSDQGPLALMSWYLIGPLTSLCLLTPLGLLPAAAGTPVLVLIAVLTGITTTTVGLTVVSRRARQLDHP